MKCGNWTCRWYEKEHADSKGVFECRLVGCPYEGLATGLVVVPVGQTEFSGVCLRGRLQFELFEQRKRWDFDEQAYLKAIAGAENVIKLYDRERDFLTLGYMDDVGQCGSEW